MSNKHANLKHSVKQRYLTQYLNETNELKQMNINFNKQIKITCKLLELLINM